VRVDRNPPGAQARDDPILNNALILRPGGRPQFSGLLRVHLMLVEQLLDGEPLTRAPGPGVDLGEHAVRVLLRRASL
jgi:hypothetical protein